MKRLLSNNMRKITSMSVSEQVERKELLPNNFVPKIGFTVNDPASEALHDERFSFEPKGVDRCEHVAVVAAIDAFSSAVISLTQKCV
ncbi:hypothetical protein DERF_006192 [Dermatophagoides farinae]|uniref:Uncharacterized protein n=1 Tax=Dermatophagoides farinae TaxID=6954 RepID=A0A922L6X9_DERFA|nr:hypothetical protein DERF_006192 [Dermatophagoides farinae]